MPLIDMREDFGLYVRYAIEHLGPGSEVLTGQMISAADIVEQLAQGLWPFQVLGPVS